MPAHSWNLCCAWCPFRVVVFARGQRGRDPGSGVEAANRMREHIEDVHGLTWQAFLDAGEPGS